MKASEAMIAWTPTWWTCPHRDRLSTKGQVKVGPLLNGGEDWSWSYAMASGACFCERRQFRGFKAVATIFIDFHTMVMRDGITPQVAHEAFLVIDEYAERISMDIPGARE